MFKCYIAAWRRWLISISQIRTMVLVYTKEWIRKQMLYFLVHLFAKLIVQYIWNYNQCDIALRNFSSEVWLKDFQIRNCTIALGWLFFYVILIAVLTNSWVCHPESCLSPRFVTQNFFFIQNGITKAFNNLPKYWLHKLIDRILP